MVKYAALPSNDYYRVGDDGSVWCRKVKGKYPVMGPWRLVNPWLKDGRSCVSVCRNGARKSRVVGPMVLESFVGPKPSPKMECCHGDGDPTNNRLSNLRWGTRKENAEDMVKHGRSTKGKTFTVRRGEQCVKSVLTETDVLDIIRAVRNGETMTAIAWRYKVGVSTVNDIDKGRAWKHISRGCS